jgi:DNA-binding NarL/FixJ family response regulator
VVQRKILIVDDFEPFRRFLCVLLQREPKLQVIGQASDGLEAVQLAEELQPDLILLDVGLPRLNGIEAARQIRDVAPGSRILFVSHESSGDLIGETVRLGAHGYIHKSRILSDLLLAIERVFAGEQFVRSGVEIKRDRPARAPIRHEVQFYSADPVLLETFARFTVSALKIGNPAVILATNSHREGLIERLKGEGFDIGDLIQQGTFVALDANDMLATIKMDGSPDSVQFFERFCIHVRAAAKAAKVEYPRVAVCDECAGLLCAEGNLDAALQIEKMGNHLSQSGDFVEVMCAYPFNAFKAPDDESFKSVCAAHTAIHS